MIHYPAFFPLFRFEVTAPVAPAFGRHQHPSEGTLCLIDQGTMNWLPSMKAADIIAEQLPKIEAANQATGAYADEVPAPEPVSMYFVYTAGSEVILPAEAYGIPADRREGQLTIAAMPTLPVLRGYATFVDGRPGTLPDLRQAFPGSTPLQVRWLRISRPRTAVAAEIDRSLVRRALLREPRFASDTDVHVIGLLFDDEVVYPQVMGPTWTFLVRKPVLGGWSSEFARVERYDGAAQAARIAPIAALAHARILQAGTGGLGAPAAHLLMQARVKLLRAIDPDVVTIGIAVRWPMGWSAAGVAKGQALRALAAAHYPETTVESIQWHIGHIVCGEIDERVVLENAMRDIDLVFDATAEVGVQQFLALEARRRGLPFVVVEATEGGYGGIVARFRPERDAPCWMCLQLCIEDQTIAAPRDERAGTLRLAGCAEPTFSGAAFDLVPLSALAVRVIAQALSGGAYPPWPFDVAVLHNRENNAGDVDGTPRWAHHRLSVHPRCGWHA